MHSDCNNYILLETKHRNDDELGVDFTILK